MFSRLLYATRISLLVGVLATAISTAIGVSLGLLGGYFGGWLEDVYKRQRMNRFPEGICSLGIFIHGKWAINIKK